jgi:dipeptidyl aminopeptidase/acylaminoacyl peptidase
MRSGTTGKRTIAIDDLFRMKLVGDAQISPDGRKIAYVVKHLDRDKNDYVGNVYLWEGERAGELKLAATGIEQSRQYTAGGKDSAPRWSPDGCRLAFVSGRESKAQIYVMSTSGGEPVRLTDLPLGAGTPVWSPDGSRIAFAAPVSIVEEPEDKETARTRVIERAVYKLDGVGFTEDRRKHIFVCDVRTKEVKQITDGDWDDSEPAWAPDGRHLAFQSNRNDDWDLQSGADIWIVPCDGGEPRRVTDGRGTWTSPQFSPDGSRIAMIGYGKPEGEIPTYYSQLWSISRGGGEPVNLLAGTDLAAGNSISSDWSIAGEDTLIWRKEGIFFLVSQRGTSDVYRWQDGLHRVTSGCKHIMDFSVAGRSLAYTASDATHPAEIFLERTGAGKKGSGEAAASHNEILSEARVVSPEKIVFCGAEGAEIDGWLMKPADYVEGQRYPLVVYIHGGPVFAYGETFFHEFQALAAAGFGLFYCNPHGGSTYGQAFQVSIMGDWGNLDYQDVMAGVDHVAGLPWVDANRLGVAGGSYGGFMVNWIIGHSDRFAAACTQRSICNHISQGGTSDWAATRGERLGGTPESDPERLWTMSPLKYVANVKTPTLILHSERDDRCPIEQGEQWFAALRRRRVPVRFVRFPEESHGLSRGGKPSRRVERMEHIVRWFKTYL